MAAPLSGIRVIEVANYVAAPSVGALMADLGADVIKVEPPGGEVMRGVLNAAGEVPEVNFLFELENRGKRSVIVDLNSARGPEVVHRLLGHADILLTNLIAGRRAKYGLSADEVRARHPRVIHVSVTGYGTSGPDAGRPGFDYSAFWARSGIMSLVGHPGQPPVLSRVAQGDHTTGMNALAASLAALRVRDQTGEGQVVEVTLQQTGVYTIATDFARALASGRQPGVFDRERPTNPMHNTYPTRDGRWLLLVHMTPDPYWPRLCRALGLSEWENDDQLATMQQRGRRSEELAGAIERRFREHDLAYWAEKLDDHGLIWAPMVELPDVARDPQLREVGAFQEVPHAAGAFETVGVPFTVRGAGIGIRRAAPTAGEHTTEVLTECGVSGEEMTDLAAGGVFG
jgi:crotonobetainyl-CoA:carnitine CoA-transferase CaiB-like acyl-CoA transferase